VLENLKAQVERIAVTQYLCMEKTGNWDVHGQDRIKDGFARILLQIPPEQSVSYSDLERFQGEIEKRQKAYGLLEKLCQQAQDAEIDILGQKLKTGSAKMPINDGKQFYLTIGKFGQYPGSILAECRHEQYGEYDITVLTKEIMRTPNYPLNVPASNEDGDIEIREDVLREIFNQKWAQDFEDHQANFFAFSDAERIASNLRGACVQALDYKGSLAEKQNLFVDIAGESLIYHEIAAVENKKARDSHPEAIVAECIKQQNVFNNVVMAMAEWYPQTKTICGPLQNIVNTATLDDKKARGMLWQYLSDAWFYDTNMIVMNGYSRLMFIPLLSYMSSPEQVDFKALGDAIPTIYRRLFAWYRKAATELHQRVTSITYRDDGKEIRCSCLIYK